MKPKIGTKIYVLRDSDMSIVKQYVFFLGKDSFMPSASKEFYDGDYNFEQYYDEYDNRWFTNLKDAKEFLRRYYRKNMEREIKIYKTYEDL